MLFGVVQEGCKYIVCVVWRYLDLRAYFIIIFLYIYIIVFGDSCVILFAQILFQLLQKFIVSQKKLRYL